MLSAALAYPRRGETALRRHLVGGGILLLSVFVLPVLLVYGYVVRVARGLAAADPDPPEWEDWEDLFVDGVKFFAVTLAYSLPLVVLSFVLGLFAAVAALGAATGSAGTAVGFGLGGAVVGMLIGLVGLVVGYILPGALVNWVLEDDVAAAFHLRTVASNAASGPYLVAWLKAIGVTIVLSIVGGILMAFLLVGLLVYFYMVVVVTYLMTDGYLEAMGHESAGAVSRRLEGHPGAEGGAPGPAS